jgi:hypothetical protein
VATYTWDVQLPGHDLPQRIATTYLLDQGEEITVDGLPWLVEQVELNTESAQPTGLVTVMPAQGPLSS